MELQSEWTMPVITRHKGIEYKFNPGQIKEVPDDFPVKNIRHFKVVKEGTLNKYKEKKQKEDEERREKIREGQEEKKKKLKEKEEVNLDLNRDGKVDEKDSSIAGKVLANRRYKK